MFHPSHGCPPDSQVAAASNRAEAAGHERSRIVSSNGCKLARCVRGRAAPSGVSRIGSSSEGMRCSGVRDEGERHVARQDRRLRCSGGAVEFA